MALKADCIFMCQKGVMSWAVTNTRRTSSGTSLRCWSVPFSTMSSIIASEWKPRSRDILSKT